MNPQSQSFDIASQVDSICDRFEAAWDEGQRPSIEAFCSEVAAENRELLLHELLLIECEMLTRAGLSVNPQTYLDRFPENTTIILEAIEEYSSSQQKTNQRLDSALTVAMGAVDTSANGTVLQSGEVLGDYLIIEELGRGGMGIVYRAKQRSAGREVALKVIGAGRLQGRTSSQQTELVHRFHTEAQATARLNHPNIVTVYEVGDIRGLHFFSMEYVRGRSLADMLAEGPLDCRVAARYMGGVVRGVQLAHEHSILHRDLNPRNILIDQATDEPLVADFGLAKMLDAEQQETVAGAVFGSPPYMPPEQVSEASQVREAADIYSLGATLYHMIAGRPPFLAASVAATLYQVLHDLPLRPRELDASVDRDLETICLKCLQKEPGERYLKASDLADDLERYLNNQPIHARPLGPIGHFWRWCLRNQMMASVITIAVTLLTISSLFSADAYIKARHALARVEEERKIAGERRDEAMIYLQLISKSVGELVEHVSTDPQLREQGLEELRRSQLEVASRVYDQLLDYHPDDPELLAAQAEAFHQQGQIQKLLGQIGRAEAAFQSALSTFDILLKSKPDNVEWKRKQASMHAELGLLYLIQERLDDARKSFSESQAIRKKLVQEHADLTNVQRDQAIGVTQQGQLSEAQLDLAHASEQYEQARSEFERLVELDPQDSTNTELLAECWLHLGRVYTASGKLADAERSYRSGLELLEKIRSANKSDPELLEIIATGQNNLADVLIRSARPKQASEAFQNAATVFHELVQQHPNVGSYLHKLAICNNNLASLHQEEGDLQSAEVEQRLAIEAMESLVKQFPAGLDYKRDLALSHLNLGILLGETDQVAESKSQLDEAQILFAQLADQYPHVVSLKQELAKSLVSKGKLLLAENSFAEAEPLLEQAEEIQKLLVEDFPHVPEYHRALAATLDSLAVAAVYQDRPEQAEQRLAAATDIYVKLSERFPASLEILRELAQCRMRQGLLLSDGNDSPQALEAMESAIQILEKLCAGLPGNASLSEELAEACFQLGTLRSDEKADQSLQRAIEVWKQLYDISSSPLLLIQQSRALSILAQNHIAQNRWEDSLKWQSQAIEASKLFGASRPEDVYASQVLPLALLRRAETFLKLKRFDEAMTDWQAVLELASDQNRPTLQIDWARSLAEAGQLDSVGQVLKSLKNEQNLSRSDYVEAARVSMIARKSVTSNEQVKESERKQLEQQLASDALSWLQLALREPEKQTPEELAAQSAARKSVAADGDFTPLHDLPEWIALFPAKTKAEKLDNEQPNNKQQP